MNIWRNLVCDTLEYSLSKSIKNSGMLLEMIQNPEILDLMRQASLCSEDRNGYSDRMESVLMARVALAHDPAVKNQWVKDEHKEACARIDEAFASFTPALDHISRDRYWEIVTEAPSIPKDSWWGRRYYQPVMALSSPWERIVNNETELFKSSVHQLMGQKETINHCLYLLVTAWVEGLGCDHDKSYALIHCLTEFLKHNYLANMDGRDIPKEQIEQGLWELSPSIPGNYHISLKAQGVRR
jgi:hypothetical protein